MNRINSAIQAVYLHIAVIKKMRGSQTKLKHQPVLYQVDPKFLPNS